MKKQINTNKEESTAFFKIRQGMLRWKRQLADYLNIVCQNLSPDSMMALFTLFSILVSAYLLKLIINAIY